MLRVSGESAALAVVTEVLRRDRCGPCHICSGTCLMSNPPWHWAQRLHRDLATSATYAQTAGLALPYLRRLGLGSPLPQLGLGSPLPQLGLGSPLPQLGLGSLTPATPWHTHTHWLARRREARCRALLPARCREGDPDRPCRRAGTWALESTAPHGTQRHAAAASLCASWPTDPKRARHGLPGRGTLSYGSAALRCD